MRRSLTRIRYKLSHSIKVRRATCSLYRALNRHEGKRVGAYMAALEGSLVAMNFHKPHLVEHIKDLYWALLKHERLKPLPVYPGSPWGGTRDKRTLDWFGDRFGLRHGETLMPYAWLSLFEPSVIIEPSLSPLRGLFKGVPKVLSYHNLATMGFGKTQSMVRNVGDYDYLFLVGPLQKKAIMDAQKRYGGRLPEMVEVGYLRGDRLLARKGTFDREGFLASLELEDRPVVMYAPTWGEFSSATAWIDHVVDVCRDLDFNLLIRLHPLMSEGRGAFETGGVSWDEKLSGILLRFPRARVLMDHDIDHALLAADVLITDVSSVGMDFMILGKPVVFLPAPAFFQLFGDEFPISRVRSKGVVKSRGELLNRLERLGEGAQGISVEEMVYNPGRALEVMVDFLEGIVS